MSLNIQERDLLTGELKRTIVAGNSNIVDTAIKTDSTWSSKKINDSLVNIDDKLEEKVDKDLANATGTLPVANGGTGATTAKGAQNALLSDIQTETTAIDDSTEFVMKYGTPTDTKGALFKRSATLVWNYIKDKISSVLGLTKETYGGKAASAGTAGYAKNMYQRTLDLSALDKTKFYPLVGDTDNNFVEVAIHSESVAGSMEYNQNRIHFDISTHGWNDLPFTLNIREYACFDNNEITIGCICRGIYDGDWAIWLRGGIRYTCFSRNAVVLTLHTSDYTYGDETYTVGTHYYGGSNSNLEVVFTPQSTIKQGSYSSRPITAPVIQATTNFIGNVSGNSESANKIKPNYTTNVALSEVTSETTKYIKIADCAWHQAGTLQVYLEGNTIVDTLVINFGGGSAITPMLCGYYHGNSNGVYSVIAQNGSTWNSDYSIYVKIRQTTTCSMHVALLKGSCTINITESTTAPTNISEWPVNYGLFGNLTSPNITSLEQRVTALESKLQKASN